MARPANPENRYSLTCKVTGEATKTNPKQFNQLMNRYGITATELDNSYVSRKGRKTIEAEKLSPEQAVEKYGIHINVANSLKCTVKAKPVVEPVNGAVEVPSTETSVDESVSNETETSAETVSQEMATA